MPAWKVPHSLNIAITVMFSYVCIVRKFSKTLKPSKSLQTPPTLKPSKPLKS